MFMLAILMGDTVRTTLVLFWKRLIFILTVITHDTIDVTLVLLMNCTEIKPDIGDVTLV